VKANLSYAFQLLQRLDHRTVQGDVRMCKSSFGKWHHKMITGSLDCNGDNKKSGGKDLDSSSRTEDLEGLDHFT